MTCALFGCGGDSSLETTIAQIGTTPNTSKSRRSSNGTHDSMDDPWAVHVELSACDVVTPSSNSAPYTVFTFHFRIHHHIHSFDTRYSTLLKLHEALLRSGAYAEAFKQGSTNRSPQFPPKTWFLDMTKPKHYASRSVDLLAYLRCICSEPDILQNQIFQNGIKLTPLLKTAVNAIATDLKNKRRLLKEYERRGRTSMSETDFRPRGTIPDSISSSLADQAHNASSPLSKPHATSNSINIPKKHSSGSPLSPALEATEHPSLAGSGGIQILASPTTQQHRTGDGSSMQHGMTHSPNTAMGSGVTRSTHSTPDKKGYNAAYGHVMGTTNHLLMDGDFKKAETSVPSASTFTTDSEYKEEGVGFSLSTTADGSGVELDASITDGAVMVGIGGSRRTTSEVIEQEALWRFTQELFTVRDNMESFLLDVHAFMDQSNIYEYEDESQVAERTGEYRQMLDDVHEFQLDAILPIDFLPVIDNEGWASLSGTPHKPKMESLPIELLENFVGFETLIRDTLLECVDLSLIEEESYDSTMNMAMNDVVSSDIGTANDNTNADMHSP